MDWYIKFLLYFISVSISMITLWQVDFNKFMRVNKKNLSIVVWLILSIAIGCLIGMFFIEIGTILSNIKK